MGQGCHRSTAHRRGLAALLPGALALSNAGLGDTAPPMQSAGDPRADLLLIVDCLLPGQIRHLGQRSVYVSPRRPARLPARDCQIRGGEYVAYDRADLKSALGAWLPLAEHGDVGAQEIVGEIYERGLGVAPDYAAALGWYRQAADAGSRRAQVNIGYLYERGLGVPADAAIALDWYRRAAGREAAIELDPPAAAPAPSALPATPPAPSPAEAPTVPAADSTAILALRSRTQELEQSLAALRTELEASRQELAVSRSHAAAAVATATEARRQLQEMPPPPPDRSDEIATLQQELARRSDDAAALARELAAERAGNQRRQAALEQAGQESSAARAAVEDERGRLREAAARLAERERELSLRRTETERLGRDMVAAAELAASRQQQNEQLARELARSQALAGEQQARTEQLEKEIAAANALAQARQERLDRLERPVAAGLLAGPEVSLVMPGLTRTRDIVPVARSPGPEAQIVGRVTAPAGIVAVTVNDLPVATSDLGVFSLRLPVGAADTPVSIVAVDRQGKRGETRFVLRGAAATPAAPVARRPTSDRELAAGVEFGSYHALVIGNNEYRSLPDLTSPMNDATALAKLLEQRYGFRTTLLLDADRYQILSALNTLRERLTSTDNLLVYFAGHGELDEVNQRAYWLPVDAERSSTANWIPTDAVTDILNVMQAKQILLVVDSCYAGALTRSSVSRLRTGMTAEERLHWFRTMAGKRSRTVLTSGGIAPVLDAGGGRHSVFAKALLEVLEANEDALDGQRLHREVAARVAYAAANLRFDQVPEYAPIRHAGHEAGEFFLIPGS